MSSADGFDTAAAQRTTSSCCMDRGSSIRFSDDTSFAPAYQRNNKANGQKNLRCFPNHCRIDGHQRGFCGHSIKVMYSFLARPHRAQQHTARPPSSPEEVHGVYAIGVFSRAGVDELEIGSRVTIESIKAQLRTNSNDRKLFPYLEGQVLQARFTERGETHICFEFNRNLKGWHYSFTGNKLTRNVFHTFAVYVLETQDDGMHYEVQAKLTSPAWQIYCRRRNTGPLAIERRRQSQQLQEEMEANFSLGAAAATAAGGGGGGGGGAAGSSSSSSGRGGGTGASSGSSSSRSHAVQGITAQSPPRLQRMAGQHFLFDEQSQHLHGAYAGTRPGGLQYIPGNPGGGGAGGADDATGGVTRDAGLLPIRTLKGEPLGDKIGGASAAPLSLSLSLSQGAQHQQRRHHEHAGHAHQQFDDRRLDELSKQLPNDIGPFDAEEAEELLNLVGGDDSHSHSHSSSSSPGKSRLLGKRNSNAQEADLSLAIADYASSVSLDPNGETATTMTSFKTRRGSSEGPNQIPDPDVTVARRRSSAAASSTASGLASSAREATNPSSVQQQQQQQQPSQSLSPAVAETSTDTNATNQAFSPSHAHAAIASSSPTSASSSRTAGQQQQQQQQQLSENATTHAPSSSPTPDARQSILSQVLRMTTLQPDGEPKQVLTIDPAAGNSPFGKKATNLLCNWLQLDSEGRATDAPPEMPPSGVCDAHSAFAGFLLRRPRFVNTFQAIARGYASRWRSGEINAVAGELVQHILALVNENSEAYLLHVARARQTPHHPKPSEAVQSHSSVPGLLARQYTSGSLATQSTASVGTFDGKGLDSHGIHGSSLSDMLSRHSSGRQSNKSTRLRRQPSSMAWLGGADFTSDDFFGAALANASAGGSGGGGGGNESETPNNYDGAIIFGDATVPYDMGGS